MEDYYTVQEVCKLLNSTPKTVIKWINEGTLEGKQFIKHGHWFIDKLSVPAYSRKGKK